MRRARTRVQRRRREGGQGLPEFAIVLPVVMLAVCGLFDVGRLVYTNSALSQAAREGARLAATEAAWVGMAASACVDAADDIDAGRPGAFVCPPEPTDLRAHVAAAVNRLTVGLDAVTDVHISCNVGTDDDPAPTGDWTDGPGGTGNGCEDGSGRPLGAAGDLVSVRVEYVYRPVTPVISSLLGSVPLSGSASMVIN